MNTEYVLCMQCRTICTDHYYEHLVAGSKYVNLCPSCSNERV